VISKRFYTAWVNNRHPRSAEECPLSRLERTTCWLWIFRQTIRLKKLQADLSSSTALHVEFFQTHRFRHQTTLNARVLKNCPCTSAVVCKKSILSNSGQESCIVLTEVSSRACAYCSENLFRLRNWIVRCPAYLFRPLGIPDSVIYGRPLESKWFFDGCTSRRIN
jgi:hypothetical protein